jgi:hypothetical protein
MWRLAAPALAPVPILQQNWNHAVRQKKQLPIKSMPYYFNFFLNTKDFKRLRKYVHTQVLTSNEQNFFYTKRPYEKIDLR